MSASVLNPTIISSRGGGGQTFLAAMPRLYLRSPHCPEAAGKGEAQHLPATHGVPGLGTWLPLFRGALLYPEGKSGYLGAGLGNRRLISTPPAKQLSPRSLGSCRASWTRFQGFPLCNAKKELAFRRASWCRQPPPPPRQQLGLSHTSLAKS